MSELVEYIESERGWGWWCDGWVDKAQFFRDVTDEAMLQMHLPPEDLANPDRPTTHGYARMHPASSDGYVTLNETPNGGRRATYVWWSL